VLVRVAEEVDTRAAQREAPSGLQLVVMASAGSQRVDLPRTGTVTIGRGDTATVKIDDDSISRAHAALHVRNTLQLEDLGSSNGTFLHGARLSPGQRVDLVAGEFFELGSVVCVIRGLGATDRAHQLRTHEYFDARLQDEIARARRNRSHPAVIRIRFDDDDAAVATLIDAVRPGDIVARYAPGEYEVLVVDGEIAAASELARVLGERIGGAELGVAVYPHDGSSAQALFAAACRMIEPDADGESDLVIESPTMRRLHELLARIAAGGTNVLLLGETGVGKEVFASRLHALSPRAQQPFVKLNCAAFTESLLESELFGHEKGSFTGADRRKQGLLETAHGGMVFLDEIGELEPTAQAKLLRAIEDRRVRRVGGIDEIAIDVVFVGATNRDLAADVAAGKFRADLFYRLDGFSLTIPPLRERRDEILPLARGFLAAAARRMGIATPPAIAEDCFAPLTGYHWTGNLRELRNTVERAIVLSGGATITPEHLPLETFRSGADALEQSLHKATSSEPPSNLTDDERSERARIIETLASVYGNQTRAAELLGISRRWLTTLIARYRIPRPRKRD
jgi:two-component system, NtrC family, response regulator AtoC